MRLICLLILFSAFKSAGSSLYEQCDWKNKAYTERLIRESQKLFPKTEACSDCFMPEKKGQNWWFEWINDFFLWPKEEDIPVECFFASGTKTLTKGPGSKNYYYCKSKKSMKPLEKMRLTDSRGKRRYVSPRKPCLNFPYTLMTSKAFHYMTDCFDFSQREKNYLFALFNRESSFILNNRSKDMPAVTDSLELLSLRILMRVFILKMFWEVKFTGKHFRGVRTSMRKFGLIPK